VRAPDDVISILPIRPNGINHDLGLGDSGFNRRVVPNAYNEEPNFMTKPELLLDLFQLLLRPSCDGEREWSRTGTFWVRVEVLGYLFPGKT